MISKNAADIIEYKAQYCRKSPPPKIINPNSSITNPNPIPVIIRIKLSFFLKNKIAIRINKIPIQK